MYNKRFINNILFRVICVIIIFFNIYRFKKCFDHNKLKLCSKKKKKKKKKIIVLYIIFIFCVVGIVKSIIFLNNIDNNNTI